MIQTTALNKFAFFEDVGYTPHDGQRKIHESTALRRICCSGVRWGKSLCAAAEALAAAMEPKDRSIGWIVGPNYDLTDKIFRELVIMVTTRLRHRLVKLKENDKRLLIRNLSGGVSEIRGKSADNPTSLLGEGLHWCILDECSRLKPEIWSSYISQRLIDHRGWSLAISTPKGKGWLFDAYRRGQGDDEDYESWNSPSWENPHLDASLIEAERERLPEKVFRQEYGAEFLEGAGQVFRNIREAATGNLSEPFPTERYFAGLDLAKVNDYTVLTILNSKLEVVFVDRFHRIDWSIQVNRIQAACTRYNMAVVLVDTTGVGAPIFENLRSVGMNCQPFPFTQKSKADLVNNLSVLLEQRLIKLPRPEICNELIDELEGFEFSVTDSGHVKTGAASGLHDDCVVSLALAAWHHRSRQVPSFYSGRPRR